MYLTFYFLLVIGSSSKISTFESGKNKELIQNTEELSSETDLIKSKFENYGEDAIYSRKPDEIEPSPSSKDHNEHSEITKLDNMLINVDKATDEIIKEIYNLYFLKSLIPPSSRDYPYSKVNYVTKDNKFYEYFKTSFEVEFKNYIGKIKKKNTEIKNFDIKKYDDAYSNFILAKKGYDNLFAMSKNPLENYIVDLNKGKIEIEVYNHFIPNRNKYSEINPYKMSFDDIKSAENFIKYIYLLLDTVEYREKISNAGNTIMQNLMLLPSYFKFYFNVIYIFSSCKKEMEFYSKKEGDLSYENQANIFNAIIEFLNVQKLKYLKKTSYISDNVYKKLTILFDDIHKEGVYEVNIADGILKLYFKNTGDRLNSKTKPVKDNEALKF